MVRKRKYGKWMPVHLTENLISEGLVGIEELTDYKIVKRDRGRTIHKATGRKSIVVPTDGGFQLTSAKRKKKI